MSILNTDQFPGNPARFEELKRACQRGFVIPFVGAGLPAWKEYLLNLCPEGHLDAGAMRERLDRNGDYEGLMNDLVQTLGDTSFHNPFCESSSLNCPVWPNRHGRTTVDDFRFWPIACVHDSLLNADIHDAATRLGSFTHVGV